MSEWGGTTTPEDPKGSGWEEFGKIAFGLLCIVVFLALVGGSCDGEDAHHRVRDLEKRVTALEQKK